jgi:hypothetical protein
MLYLKVFVEFPRALPPRVEATVAFDDDEDEDAVGKEALNELYASVTSGGWYQVDADGNEIDD